MSIQLVCPLLKPDDAKRLALSLFGLHAVNEPKNLGSCQDSNWRIDTASGLSYVLKVVNDKELLGNVDLQVKAMQHLTLAWQHQHATTSTADKGSGSILAVPQPAPTLTGDGSGGESFIAEVELSTTADGGVAKKHFVVAISLLEGKDLESYPHMGLKELRSMGRCVSLVLEGLSSFSHPHQDRGPEMQWDSRIADKVVKDLSVSISDRFGPEDGKERVLRLNDKSWAALKPLSPHLPLQVIHNDLAHYNVMAVKEEASCLPIITGVIDFGDIGIGWRVAELSTAIAALLSRDMPALDQACAVLAGFKEAGSSLNVHEVMALWPLVAARACILVTCAEHQVKIDPENSYNSDGLEDDWNVLLRVEKVPFVVAEEAFRSVLGMDPRPASLAASAWLDSLAGGAFDSFCPIVDLVEKTETSLVDFGVRSLHFDAGGWLSRQGVTKAVQRASSSDSNAEVVALGAYGEIRLVNSMRRSPTTSQPFHPPDTVSLGMEIFLPVGSSVYAPVDSYLVSVTPDDGEGEGGKVVLRIMDAEGFEFDILASGITPCPSLPSLLSLSSEGSTRPLVKSGSIIGTVSPVSSDPPSLLPSHLRLQVSTIVEAFVLPLPPSCPVASSPAWMRACPPPAALIGLKKSQGSHPSSLPSSHEPNALTQRKAFVARVQEHYFKAPPQIERGFKNHLYDTHARPLLDVVNNVAILGHSHPKVTQAATNQLQLLNTNSRFVYQAMGEVAAKIVALMPPGSGLDQVFLVNSGSEAVDLALRLARTYTDRRDVICLEGAYHGVTTASDEITTTLNDNPRSRETRPPWIHLVPRPDPYRGPVDYDAPGAGSQYAEPVKKVVANLVSKGPGPGGWFGTAPGGPAAFIAESLQGNAGGAELPPGYLQEVYSAVRGAGGLCIADEVQVGYGRLGSNFWAFMEHGVIPDIITVAKAAGNGHPFGYVVTNKKVAEALSMDGSFFSSAGGCPVSCVVGSAVIDTVLGEGLQENARRVGSYLRDKLLALAAKHPSVIGYIHGHGLYQGIEIIKKGPGGGTAAEPGTMEAKALCERMLELGVICHSTGDYSNIMKVKPPLCFTEQDSDYFVAALDVALSERDYKDSNRSNL